MSRIALRLTGWWISVLLLVLGLAPAPPAGADSPNLLVNPGFEEGLTGHPWMPAGWDTSRANLPTVFFGRDTFLVHSGRYSVNVANASALFSLAHNWSQMLLVTPDQWGKDMVFSVWTRSNGVDGRAYIKVEAYQDTISKMSKIWGLTRDEAAQRLRIPYTQDPVMDLAWKREFFSKPNTDWVHRQVRVYLPPTTNVAFVRCGLMGTGQLLVDDASLTLEPALPPEPVAVGVNLLKDPGFEGDGNAWEYSLPPFPDMRAEQDSAVVHSGKYSLRMTSPPTAILQGKTGVCQVLCNRNLAGKHLKFTGYIKTDSLHSSAFLKLYCHTLHGEKQFASSGIFAGTVDWRQAHLEADTPPDTYSVWAWFQYIAPTKGRVYFDDASLEVTGPARAEP